MSRNRTPEGRVLFIHPTGPDRDLYVSALDEAGFHTTAAATVGEAVALLDQAPFDVMTLELLPDPGKAWVLLEQRSAAAPGVPLIALTVLIRADREHRRRARALGCAAFVAKPCSVPLLVDVVRRVRRGTRGLEISTYA